MSCQRWPSGRYRPRHAISQGYVLVNIHAEVMREVFPGGVDDIIAIGEQAIVKNAYAIGL